jgi:hypothetical protein
MVESGELPYYRIGRRIRFKPNDVDRWMESHRHESVNANAKAQGILKATNKGALDIDRVIKKSIEEAKGKRYTSSQEKPGRIKGLGKEVKDGLV